MAPQVKPYALPLLMLLLQLQLQLMRMMVEGRRQNDDDVNR